MKRETAMRALSGVLSSIFALLVVMVAIAPARATEAGDTSGTGGGTGLTMYVIEDCSMCGQDHKSWFTEQIGLGALVAIGNDPDYVNLSIVSSDESVVTAERLGEDLLIVAQDAGEATVTVTADNATTIPAVISVRVLSVSDLDDIQGTRYTYNPENVLSYRVTLGDPLGVNNGWAEPKDGNILEQSVLDTLAEWEEYDFSVGDTWTFSDGVTRTFRGYRCGEGDIDPSQVPSEDAFSQLSFVTKVDTAADLYELTHIWECPVWAQWSPDPDTGIYEPSDVYGNLLFPYSVNDGVMTFDGIEDLGEWYQLDLSLGEGVSCEGTFGDAYLSKTMAIDASGLSEDDPLYSSDGAISGPFWIRGDNGDESASFKFEVPDREGLRYRLNPVSAGSLSFDVADDGGVVLSVQLDAPATLVVEKTDVITVDSGDGATLEVSAGSTTSEFYGGVSFEVAELEQTESEDAVSVVNAMINGTVGTAVVYDLHLEDSDGNEVQPLEGDSVTVTLPIPESLSAEGLRVFHVADDGAVTDMGATVDAEAGTVSFTTTHFSTFVLANVETGDSGQGTGGQAAKPEGEEADGAGEGDGGQTTEPAGEKADGLAETGDAGALPALLAGASGSAALLGAAVLRRRR